METRLKPLSRERRRQLRNLAAGLCERCSAPRVNSRFCAKHRDQFRLQDREYKRRKRAR